MTRTLPLAPGFFITTFVASCISLPASGHDLVLCIGQREVNGIIHQSALLATSFKPAFCPTLKLKWRVIPDPTPIASLLRTKCSLLPGRSTYNCSDKQLVASSYEGRVHIFPENGSLLLNQLQLNDSGVYEISVYSQGDNSVRGNLTLMVHNETESVTPTPSMTTNSARGWIYITVAVSGSTLLVILLMSCWLHLHMTQWGCHQRRESNTERFVQLGGASQQDVNKPQITYCLLQLPHGCSPTAGEPDTGIVYTVSRKVQ
ncbi:uncharacterized protein [Narcine bancroftii]|uniref:uncharacterized protein n=1 Tax=Narcine bancroftii TaxID=1343680 RepID=UPI00383214BA